MARRELSFPEGFIMSISTKSLPLPTSAPAAVRTSLQPRSIRVFEQDLPVPGPGEVLVRTEYCGLCGSDLHIWNGDDGYDWVPCGTVLGHEIVGTVVRVNGSSAIAPGTRVVPVAQSGCGDCPACESEYANGCAHRLTLGLSQDGGAAGFVRIPFAQLILVPEHIPALTGSHGTTVGGSPSRGRPRTRHACRHRGGQRPRHDRHTCGVLKGPERDVAARSGLAAQLGLELVAELPPGYRPNVWIEAAGAAAALDDAVRELSVLGRLVVVALYGSPPVVAANDAVRKELNIITSYSSHRADYELAVRILQERPDLGDLLVDVVPLRNIALAFEKVGRGIAPKVAVAP